MLRNCVCQNIPLRDQNHPEVSQSGITNLGTLRDKNFFKIYSITSISCLSLDFVLFCFCGISRQTVILISYGFFCFTS